MLPNESRTDPQHGRDTHRELITFVASMSSIELERARTTWADSAKKVQQVADLIEQRLNALTGPDGWTGAGAEQFAKTIRKDLVDNLRAYALRAGGLSPQGTQEKSHANDIRQIQDAVAASIESAANNNIPWDVETKWNIKQKDVEQGILSKIDELVTGKDEEYEKAKKDAPYEVLNGSAAVVKNVPKPEFEVIDNSIPDQVSSPVYQQAKLPIDSNTQRFDKICEALSIGSAEKQQVYGKVVGVETALAAYAPATATKGQFTDTNPEVGNAGKVDGGNPDGRTSGSPAPKGTGQGETGANMPDPTKADLPGNVASPDLGGTPGTVESLPDSNDPTSPRIDLPTGTVGDAGPGSFQPSDPITGIGGGKPSTVVGAPGTAGAGAGLAAPIGTGGAPNFTSGPPGATVTGIGGGPGAPGGPMMMGGAPGAGSLGNLGSAGLGGKQGASFQVGPNGKGLVNPGNVGSLPGKGGLPGGAGVGSGTPTGVGAGGQGGQMGGAPLGGRRKGQERSEEENDPELEGTWLEEDRSVWGNRPAAPPSEIR